MKPLIGRSAEQDASWIFGQPSRAWIFVVQRFNSHHPLKQVLLLQVLWGKGILGRKGGEEVWEALGAGGSAEKD